MGQFGLFITCKKPANAHHSGKKFQQTTIRNIFFYLSHKTIFDISCNLSPVETICMKYQILFCGKNMKNIINLSSADLALRLVKVNHYHTVGNMSRP